MSRLRRLLEPVNWKYAVGEVSLIVVGVLIALGVDAWWERREERVTERAYVQQLLADARENQRRIEAAIHEDSLIRQTQREWLEVLMDSGPLPPEDSLKRWFEMKRFWEAADPRLLSGTYDALRETGDLQLVRDDSLRFGLIAYHAALEAARERMQLAREDHTRRTEAVMRHILPRFPRGPLDVGFHPMLTALRGNPDVWFGFRTLMAGTDTRLTTLRSLRDENQILLRLLRAEVGETVEP